MITKQYNIKLNLKILCEKTTHCAFNKLPFTRSRKNVNKQKSFFHPHPPGNWRISVNSQQTSTQLHTLNVSSEHTRSQKMKKLKIKFFNEKTKHAVVVRVTMGCRIYHSTAGCCRPVGRCRTAIFGADPQHRSSCSL